VCGVCGVLGVLGVTLTASTTAHAQQPSGQDIAVAQGLFDEGKRLMQAGKYDEGCPKLVESQRLDPAGGTLLVIALCHEGQGKTATAWAEFGEALGQARRDHRSDREAAALEHIKAIEPKLTRLRIVVNGKTEGLEVRRDGARVGEAQWGTPLPVDPGDHTFEARAPFKKTWFQSLPVKGEGATIDVTIPPLAEDVAPAVVAAPAAGTTGTTGTAAGQAPPAGTRLDQDSGSDRSTRLTWAAIVGGVGVVATGVGVAFGASAASQWSDAHKACPNAHCTNDADRQKGIDAGKTADVSTVFFLVGGAALATGIVLWVTAPSAHDVHVAPAMGRDSGGLVLGGTL